MSNTYCIFPFRVQIKNMNAKSGDLLCGIPPLTTSIGFLEALRRKLPNCKTEDDETIEWNQELDVEGIAVCYHEINLQMVKGFPNNNSLLIKGTHDTRNAKVDKGVSIMPHAIMNVEATIFLRMTLLEDEAPEMENLYIYIRDVILPTMRFGGGIILSPKMSPQLQIKPWTVYTEESQKQMRRCLARLGCGYFFEEVSELLLEHFEILKKEIPEASRITALMHFLQIFIKGNEKIEIKKESESIKHLLSLQKDGYLYPMTMGYSSITPVYDPGTVANTRDKETPVVAVEPVYSLCRALASVKIQNEDDFLKLFWKPVAFEEQERKVYVAKQFDF